VQFNDLIVLQRTSAEMQRAGELQWQVAMEMRMPERFHKLVCGYERTPPPTPLCVRRHLSRVRVVQNVLNMELIDRDDTTFIGLPFPHPMLASPPFAHFCVC
jgi:hypothetical protein